MKDHISICICTFRRPELLRRLLEKVHELSTSGLFHFSVVVVDNDSARSAEPVVKQLAATSQIELAYHHEPERSISLARNRSVRNAAGNLIAFIDDDEFPDPQWLVKLYETLNTTGGDGVLGPVLPHFDTPAPRWLVKSGLLDRQRFATGHVLREDRHTRTGNVLLRRSLFAEGDMWFDPAYGRTGGGDAAFFRRMIAKGRVFVWCDEGCVYETVPPERQTRTYHIRRGFTRGMTSAWQTRFFSRDTLLSVIAVLLYTAALPFLLLLGHHLFMLYLIKDCDHLAKICGKFGIRPVRERPYNSLAPALVNPQN